MAIADVIAASRGASARPNSDTTDLENGRVRHRRERGSTERSMSETDLRDRIAVLERAIAEDAEHRHRINERIDALRGVILGIVVALNDAHPEVSDTLVDALRRFAQEAGKMRALDAAVSDTRELVEMIVAQRE
jgi:hypothetical protein